MAQGDEFVSVVRFGVGEGLVFEPLTVVREASSLWTQAQIDLGELAKLRQAGWTSKQLQAHFGFGRSKINLELRKLRVNAREVCKQSLSGWEV